jgi:hypothetical protein
MVDFIYKLFDIFHLFFRKTKNLIELYKKISLFFALIEEIFFVLTIKLRLIRQKKSGKNCSISDKDLVHTNRYHFEKTWKIIFCKQSPPRRLTTMPI